METNERHWPALTIFDTTLRDGEQTPGVSLSAPQKLEIAAALQELGVDVIEAGFPAASSGEADAVAAVAAAVTRAAVCALARCHEPDILAAADALRHAARPRLHVFIATSPLHMRHKLRLSPTQVLQRARQGMRLALDLCRDVQFSAEDATRTEPAFLHDVVALAAELGVATINIPDTVGYATPAEYAEVIAIARHAAAIRPKAVISAHCHDDLGLAAANTLAGIAAGARQAECTINGLGERAGNAALEEIVMALRTRPERHAVTTGINTRRLCETSALVARLTGMVVPANKAVVGANAFAHQSGIHQHGVIGNASTYEVMRAEDVGASTRIVLGKHSGRHAFEAWLKQRGVELAESERQAAFAAFKRLADTEPHPTERRILELARPARMQPAGWKLLAVAGEDGPVTVRLADPDGRVRQGRGRGTPAEAVARAVAEATGLRLRLAACRAGFESRGDGNVATVTVEFDCEGAALRGQAIAACEVEAVAHALVDALPAARAARVEVSP
ncbi:MAG: 2-isopropylmalate synthase [Planctomycetes bacterium]|nr:2-isopropylmalate synthase [Planctomycetota bacterium]MCL4730025.1 2-isopropylmalate synthase [Planctomycetota bacterium]